jgi:Cytidine and deoxycytidylate deaminase zinc-binding region.
MCKPAIQHITIRKAKESLFDTFRHGCTIEKSGRVIASGVNTPKPRTPNSSFSTHAEQKALKRLLTILTRQRSEGEKYELYVARVNLKDDIAFSRPCPKCLQALKNSGVISIVHFTTDDGWETVEI